MRNPKTCSKSEFKTIKQGSQVGTEQNLQDRIIRSRVALVFEVSLSGIDALSTRVIDSEWWIDSSSKETRQKLVYAHVGPYEGLPEHDAELYGGLMVKNWPAWAQHISASRAATIAAALRSMIVQAWNFNTANARVYNKVSAVRNSSVRSFKNKNQYFRNGRKFQMCSHLMEIISWE